MPTHTVRILTSIAAVAWLAVGGYGLWETLAVESGDNWETSYVIFSIGLTLGALFTVAAVWIASRQADRPLVRSIGLGICAFGVFSTIAAWALPFWMTILGVGFVIVALSGSKPWRRAVAFLAGAQLLGMVVLFAGIAAEVGPIDEHGDHPAAFGIALVVTTVATVASLYDLGRSADAVAPAARASATKATIA